MNHEWVTFETKDGKTVSWCANCGVLRERWGASSWDYEPGKVVAQFGKVWNGGVAYLGCKAPTKSL